MPHIYRMGSLDIIIMAAVAAFLAYRVYMILGQKREDEPQRGNPFVRQDNQPAKDAREDDNPLSLPGNLGEDDTPAPRALPKIEVAPGSLAGTLAQIQQLDRDFSEKDFVQGAKAAFKMIVQAFAAGDKTALRPLLSERVFQQFSAAIDARAQAGQTMTNEVVSISDASVLSAKLENGRAFITISFASQQRNALKDSAGNVVEGDARRTEDVADTWMFMRDMRENDPNWILVETRAV